MQVAFAHLCRGVLTIGISVGLVNNEEVATVAGHIGGYIHSDVKVCESPHITINAREVINISMFMDNPGPFANHCGFSEMISRVTIGR